MTSIYIPTNNQGYVSFNDLSAYATINSLNASLSTKLSSTSNSYLSAGTGSFGNIINTTINSGTGTFTTLIGATGSFSNIIISK